ncbi:MAG: squalene/phytoene synthase family protein, partial [Alphaproteobacteria bacterium]
RLDGFDRALRGRTRDPAFVKGHAIRDSLAATGVTIQHCRDLIVAFKRDATKSRYADWDDLMNYCRYSASPVGRYLLDIHGESPDGYAASDALCDALQVINHMQDLKDDYLTLDRVYLPQDWMKDEGVVVADLAAPSASPGLRRVIDRCLDGTDRLLATARTLPRRLASRRLAMESAAIIRLAEILSARLRRQDPIARRVALSKPASLYHALVGIGRYWLGR